MSIASSVTGMVAKGTRLAIIRKESWTVPRGPKGEKRRADVIGNAVHTRS
jgi:hypothetical protein